VNSDKGYPEKISMILKE